MLLLFYSTVGGAAAEATERCGVVGVGLEGDSVVVSSHQGSRRGFQRFAGSFREPYCQLWGEMHS